MGLTLYFLRHGETQASQTGGYCGVLDVDLTPEGHQMAGYLNQGLSGLHEELRLGRTRSISGEKGERLNP